MSFPVRNILFQLLQSAGGPKLGLFLFELSAGKIQRFENFPGWQIGVGHQARGEVWPIVKTPVRNFPAKRIQQGARRHLPLTRPLLSFIVDIPSAVFG